MVQGLPLRLGVKTFPHTYDQRWTTSPTKEILRGRNRCVDLRDSGWFGQDNTDGSLNLPSLTLDDSFWQAAADAGFAFITIARAMTNTGQYQLDRMIARNPNFRWFAYFRFAHLPAVRAAGDARPIDGRLYDILDGRRAVDVNGADLVAWPQGGNPANPVDSYWVDFFTDPTTGYTFNKTVIDQIADMLFEEIMKKEHRPLGLMIDYFHTRSAGYYQWPTLNAEPDLNANGVGYDSDAAEVTALQDAQKYYVEALRARFGTDFFLTGNGRGSWPSEEAPLQRVLDGWFMEGFPTTPWFDPSESFDKIWTAWTASKMYRGFHGRLKPLIHSDVRPVWSEGGTRAQAGRVYALLFDAWYRHRVADGNNDPLLSEIADEEWDSLVSTLGDPTADPTRVINGTVTTYERTFSGGSIKIMIDSSLSGVSQITYAGLGGDVTPPAMTVTPSYTPQVLGFDWTGGVADEQCIHQVRAQKTGHADQIGAWSSVYTTSISGSISSLPVDGDWTVSFKLRDQQGNETPGYLPGGTATALPNIGGG